MAIDERPIFVTIDENTFLPPERVVDAIEGATVTPHENDPTPHSAYDDAPSFVTLFENGLA
jgi:hypothetical protein